MRLAARSISAGRPIALCSEPVGRALGLALRSVETRADCFSPGDFVRRENVQCIGLERGARNSPRRKLVAMYILLSPIAPSAPQRHSGWGCAPGAAAI